MSSHARLSPSNKRWPHCPNSPNVECNYKSVSGDAAIDGTKTHKLLEMCLETKDPNFKAAQFVGHEITDEETGEIWKVDKERCDRVQIALDYIVQRDDELGGIWVAAETQSNPGYWFGRDDWYGTCDITITAISGDTLEIVDYKDGHMYVETEDNSQLISYAAGKVAPHLFSKVGDPLRFDECKIKNVRMTIIQPRIENKPIRFVEMPTAELWVKVHDLAEKAKLTDDEKAPFVAGEWCQWCPHKKMCPAYTAAGMVGVEMMAPAIADDEESLTQSIQKYKRNIPDLNDVELSQLMDAEPIIKALYEQIHEVALGRMNDGREVPGYAIGHGRGSKKWKLDEEDVAKKLKGMKFKKDEIYPPKFVSVAQALKKEGLTDRQKKRIEEELIDYKQGDQKVITSNRKVKTAKELFKDVPMPQEAPVEEPVKTNPVEDKIDLSKLFRS